MSLCLGNQLFKSGSGQACWNNGRLNQRFRYLDRIIRGSELQEFATLLKDHQKATMADGKQSRK